MARAEPPEFVAFVRDQLKPLGSITCRRFFGGWDFRLGTVQFAMAMRDTLYFRVDSRLRIDLAAAGSEPFTYNKRDRRVVVQRYYAAPESSLDDPDELLRWARRALNASDIDEEAEASDV